MIKNSEWQDRLIKKLARGNTPYHQHRMDATLTPLEDLLGKGYTNLTWKTRKSCEKCRQAARDNRDVALEEFIQGLSHDAPMAERSHPDDDSSHCYLLVYKPGEEERKQRLERELTEVEDKILDLTAKVEQTEDESEKESAQSEVESAEQRKEEIAHELDEILPPMTVDYDGNIDQA